MSKELSENYVWQKCHDHTSEFFQLKVNENYFLYSTKRNQHNLLDIFQPTFIKQIHSDTIINIDRDRPRIGDGLLTEKKGVILGIKIADCLPVYLFNKKTLCIIHCGWRGIIQGIATKAKDRLGSAYRYVLGACIGPCCYEIKRDVQELFSRRYKRALMQHGDRWFLDLKAAVQEDLGQTRMVASLDFCTKCHPEYFYSRRRGDTHMRNVALCVHK